MEDLTFSPAVQDMFCRAIATAVAQAIKTTNGETGYGTNMTREQASRCLGVAYSTLWLWAKSGKLVPYKVGKRVMYKTKDVYSLLNGENY